MSDGSELYWVESVRYLGVFIIRSCYFSVASDVYMCGCIPILFVMFVCVYLFFFFLFLFATVKVNKVVQKWPPDSLDLNPLPVLNFVCYFHCMFELKLGKIHTFCVIQHFRRFM